MARGFSRYAAVALLLAVPPVPAHAAFDSENPAPSESLPDEAIRKVIADYGKAIETKDLDLFRTVKPNLSEEEERRARTAFGTVKSQVVKITVNSVDVQGDAAVVHVSRRDTINGSLVSSFPQTFRLGRNKGAWGILEIGR
jgi:methionine-rich copper-binding protein CopC